MISLYWAYIDNILEAKKVLVKEMGGTLLTIAKDVSELHNFLREYAKLSTVDVA